MWNSASAGTAHRLGVLQPIQLMVQVPLPRNASSFRRSFSFSMALIAGAIL